MREQEPLACPPTLPAHLQPLWRELAPQVSRAIGPLGLEALCAQAYRMRNAREKIDREGEIVLDPRGNPAPHPALAIEKQAGVEVRDWLKRFARR